MTGVLLDQGSGMDFSLRAFAQNIYRTSGLWATRSCGGGRSESVAKQNAARPARLGGGKKEKEELFLW